MPAYGGWWTSDKGENWCHRVAEFKYCLPEAFELERVEGAYLDFKVEHLLAPSVFAHYLGNDPLNEILATVMDVEGVTVTSDTLANGVRIIRRVLPEEQHGMLVILVIFPDESVVKMFGGGEAELESAVNAFIQPRPTK